MKIQKYIVTIEMPDGDTISPSWLKDLIQTDCDVEECDRQKVSVEEFSKPSLPSNLDEAADKWCKENGKGFVLRDKSAYYIGETLPAFKAGAEWMAGQGVKLHGRILPGRRGNLYIESDCFGRGFGGLNYNFSDSNDVDMFVQSQKLPKED